MDRRYETEKRIWALLEPVINTGGYELLEVEFVCDRGRWILRLYIDCENNVTISDTTRVCRLVDPVLDVADPIEQAYHLEVSSPGLDRPLRKPEHFERFAGEMIRLRTRELIDIGSGRGKRNFFGVLKGCKEGRVILDEDGHIHEVPHEAIKRANVACPNNEVKK